MTIAPVTGKLCESCTAPLSPGPSNLRNSFDEFDQSLCDTCNKVSLSILRSEEPLPTANPRNEALRLYKELISRVSKKPGDTTPFTPEDNRVIKKIAPLIRYNLTLIANSARRPKEGGPGPGLITEFD